MDVTPDIQGALEAFKIVISIALRQHAGFLATGAAPVRIPLGCGNRGLGAGGAHGDSFRVPSAVSGRAARGDAPVQRR